MRVGFLQFAPRFGDKAANLALVERKLAGVQADLVVLPELYSTGYSFRSKDELAEFAEPLPDGPSAEHLAGLSCRLGTALVGGIAEQATDKVYNSCLLVTPEGQRVVYRKSHLFNNEKLIFDRGDTGPVTADVSGVKVGLEVCFDYFFPELTRSLALRGVALIAHPSNLVLHYAQQMTLTRCMENRIFWVLCNRVGTDDHDGRALTFTGQSQIVAPNGSVLFRADETEERLAVVEIDPAEADDKVVFGNHLFEDRRPECYRL